MVAGALPVQSPALFIAAEQYWSGSDWSAEFGALAVV
jgi:hypothetical protein